MKGKGNLPLCESNGWGNCCSGMGSGDEDYRQNLCTKLILIRQPRHAHILAHMACMKISKCTGKTKKASPGRTPEPLWTKQEPRMHHSNIFWHVMASSFNRSFLSLPWDNTFAQSMDSQKNVSRFDTKLRNVFHYPGESSSFKKINAPVKWRPTYRQAIHFCYEEEKKCSCSVTYTL